MLSDNVTPQVAAESLAFLVGKGERFECSLQGPHLCGKSLSLAELVWRADQLDVAMVEMAVFGRTRPAIWKLRRLIGSHWPDLDPHKDLFPPELTGVVIDALHAHSAVPGYSKPMPYEAIADDYLMKIADANQLEMTPTNANWLKSVRKYVVAAIQTDLACRLEKIALPLNAYVHLVAEHVAAYKRDYELIDFADLVHGPYYQSPQVRLLLLDEVDAQQRKLVARFFPNASIVTTEINDAGALSMRLQSWTQKSLPSGREA